MKSAKLTKKCAEIHFFYLLFKNAEHWKNKTQHLYKVYMHFFYKNYLPFPSITHHTTVTANANTSFYKVTFPMLTFITIFSRHIETLGLNIQVFLPCTAKSQSTGISDSTSTSATQSTNHHTLQKPQLKQKSKGKMNSLAIALSTSEDSDTVKLLKPFWMQAKPPPPKRKQVL
jgi:hypothetical protein